MLDDTKRDVLHDHFILRMAWPMIAASMELPVEQAEQIAAVAVTKLHRLGLPGPERWTSPPSP